MGQHQPASSRALATVGDHVPSAAVADQASPRRPGVGADVESEQIANRIKVDCRDDESMRISHEAIHQVLYIEGRGAQTRAHLVPSHRVGAAGAPNEIAPQDVGGHHPRSAHQGASRRSGSRGLFPGAGRVIC
jgi:hypothetical protein